MPNDNLGLKVFSQSLSEANVSAMVNEVISIIHKQTGRLENEIKKDFEGIKFGEDLSNQIISEMKKAEQSLGSKSFKFGVDLFKGILDSKGIESEIENVFNVFRNKIYELNKIKESIGNDKIFFDIDEKNLDKLLKKQREIIELNEEINQATNKRSKTSKQNKLNVAETEYNEILAKALTELRKLRADYNDEIDNIAKSKGIKLPEIDTTGIEKSKEQVSKSAKELKTELQKLYKDLDLYSKEDADIKTIQNFLKVYKELEKLGNNNIDKKFKQAFDEIIEIKDFKSYYDGLDKVEQSTNNATNAINKYIVSLEEARQKAQALVKENSLKPSNITDNINVSEIKEVIGYVERYLSLGGELKNLDITTQRIYGRKDQIDGINELTDAIRNYKEEAQDAGKAGTEVVLSQEINTIRQKISELENQISEMQTKLQNLDGEAFNKMQKDIDGLINKLDVANKELGKLTNVSLGDINNSQIETNKSNYNSSNLKNVNVDDAANIIKGQNELQKELKETDDAVQKIVYHWGELNTEKLGKIKSESFNKMISSYVSGMRDSGEPWGAFGTGTYVTSDPNYFKGMDTSEKPFAKFHELDVSKLKMYETKTTENAKALFDFLNTLQQYCISFASGYDYQGTFDVNQFDTEKLFNAFQTVFKESKLTFDQFETFLNNMFDLVEQAGIKADGTMSPKANMTVGNDNIATRFMKELGYQGINNAGTDFDSLQHGSVVFDIDESNIVNKYKTVEEVLAATEQQARETAQAIENIGVSGANQGKTQAEIEETKADVQQLGNEVKETKQNLEDLGKTDINPDIKDGTTPSGDMKDETPQRDSSSIISEQQALENLEKAINSVTIAIAQKNQAIQAEEVQMDHSVNEEIAKLKELEDKLTLIRTEFQNGILTRGKNTGDGSNIEGYINTNENNNITTDVVLNPKLSDTFKTDVNNLLDDVKIEKDVDLKPTYEAGKFKEETERILTFENVEKEVAFKVGDLDTSGITGTTSTVTSPVSENVASDNVIEEQNKDLEEQQFLYNNIIRLLTEYLSLQDKINSENRDIASGDLINFNDIRKQTGKVSQRAVKDQLNNYLNTSKNENGIYSDNSIKRAKEQLAAYVADFDNAEKAAEIFGNKNKELFNEITQMINDAKVSLDAYNKAQLNIDVVNDQLVELKKLQSGEKLTYGQLWGLEKVVKIDGLEAGFKYITDELGIKIPEAAKKTESALNDVDNELKDDKVKENKPFTVQVDPEINSQTWIDAVDHIISLIGTRRVKVEPDVSEEWNNFKTFVDKISNQVIHLNIDGNVDNTGSTKGDTSKSSKKKQSSSKKKQSSSIPYELNNSYKKSESLLNKLYSIENKIAQIKEENNESEFKKISALEQEKKKLEELLRLEEQVRNNKFKDVDTSENDKSLNELRNSLQQDYDNKRKAFDSSLNAVMPNIMDEAYKDNEAYDNVRRVNDLLDQQKNKWQEIQNIRIQISKLDPIDNVNEINNLNAQKSGLEKELSDIQEEIKLYDTLNSQKKQSNELDKITSNADKQVNANTLERINSLYDEYINNLKAQSKLNLDILSYPKESEKTNEEQERVNILQEELNNRVKEQANLIEKVNRALTEERGKTEEIDKILSKLSDNNLNLNDIGRTTDINDAYTAATKINDALNKTSNTMSVLRSNGKGDIFGEAFSKAETDIESLNNSLVNGNITLTQYNSKISEIKKNLSAQQNAIALIDPEDISNARSLEAVLNSYMKAATNGKAENIQFNQSAETLTGTFVNAQKRIQDVSVSIKTLSDATKVVNVEFKKARSPVSTFSKLIDEFNVKLRNLATYLASFVGFYEIWGAIKQGFTYVKELDSALVEMKKVSDESTASLKEFQKASFDIADSVGSTGKEIQNSTADWLKLGYAMEDASELAKTTAIYKAVGDNMDISGATESMVSTLEGFQLEADQAMNIVDQFNEVSNNFAIDSKGIGDALQRSAASFNAANTGLSESIALITATNTILQDPEKVGNMWRTVSARIRGKIVPIYNENYKLCYVI